MSDEKIEKLERIADKHTSYLHELKTNHKVHLAHHKVIDGKLEYINNKVNDVNKDQSKTQGNITWAVRIVLGMFIAAIVTLVLKNGGV